jgi:hypothetical protein
MPSSFVWDKIKNTAQGVKGAYQDFQAGTQRRAQAKVGQEQLKAWAGQWINQWFQMVGQNPAIKNDPAQLQNLMTKVVGTRVPNVPVPTNMSDRGVIAYINGLCSQYMSDYAIAQQAPASSGTAAASNTAAAATTTTAASAATPSLVDNFKLINSNPVIYQWGKRQFALNSTGDWSNLGSDTPIKDQNLAALLTQAAHRDGM